MFKSKNEKTWAFFLDFQLTHKTAWDAISQIEPDDFRNAAKEIGIGERIAMKRFTDMSSNFRPALSKAEQELSDAGYRAAKEMENRILQNGGISFK